MTIKHIVTTTEAATFKLWLLFCFLLPGLLIRGLERTACDGVKYTLQLQL